MENVSWIVSLLEDGKIGKDCTFDDGTTPTQEIQSTLQLMNHVGTCSIDKSFSTLDNWDSIDLLQQCYENIGNFLSPPSSFSAAAKSEKKVSITVSSLRKTISSLSELPRAAPLSEKGKICSSQDPPMYKPGQSSASGKGAILQNSQITQNQFQNISSASFQHSLQTFHPSFCFNSTQQLHSSSLQPQQPKIEIVQSAQPTYSHDQNPQQETDKLQHSRISLLSKMKQTLPQNQPASRSPLQQQNSSQAAVLNPIVRKPVTPQLHPYYESKYDEEVNEENLPWEQKRVQPLPASPPSISPSALPTQKQIASSFVRSTNTQSSISRIPSSSPPRSESPVLQSEFISGREKLIADVKKRRGESTLGIRRGNVTRMIRPSPPSSYIDTDSSSPSARLSAFSSSSSGGPQSSATPTGPSSALTKDQQSQLRALSAPRFQPPVRASSGGGGVGSGGSDKSSLRDYPDFLSNPPNIYGGNLIGGSRPSGLTRNDAKKQKIGGEKNEPVITAEMLGGIDPDDERLKGLDPKLIEMICNEIMDHSPSVHWDDIAGLEFAKKRIKENVLWPITNPGLFTGLREPSRGVLLFGPPGTGKTMIGKAIASTTSSMFFSISSSSLMSKWIGEGEKLVRTLFTVAGCHKNAIVFVDEIDSLLTSRSEGETEASRRMKTEFLVQLDGVGSTKLEKTLIIGATNRPQELDEAVRRRMPTRLYIPLPDRPARKQLFYRLLRKNSHELNDSDVDSIVTRTKGYSGSDIAALCANAAMGPVRELASTISNIADIDPSSVRPIKLSDFDSAFRQIRPSVDSKTLDVLKKWNNEYGSNPDDITLQEGEDADA
ncbi:p97G [Monocercomonoides exilis]|uniref:p97G n=1 Tax=Monocercomonoides exilis TaxID=2049356 RepID=UPI00355A6A50|nr:p97G [Monocercomonoides exilis]|eukprot:MONOS_4209.1-p1 / transcript=MONOS_4209.1 / gene=MONOS_4209 / organism=Monocercomonoides_exilis_PA203 / gene_product= p97G / transcript_product= p97G / location=Mono_scaffold00109:10830-13562(+) / protein_length=831 / sequence_SO=supercontig / SO=protein_coding / is_pseudo=false